jgi:acetyl esterase/lipase
MKQLWENGIPYAKDGGFVPTLTPYISEGSKAAVIVCPGGAYEFRAEHEGAEIAEWLNTIGVTAFVLNYRIAPEYHHPVQLSDVQRAVRHVRYYAKDYGIDEDKLAVMGFSAGGHLAGSVSVHYNYRAYEPTDEIDKVSARPNASILCYPVIDMFEYRHDGSRRNLIGENPLHADKELMTLYAHVTRDTPPAFIWHTSSDAAVPVENSLMYADALSKVQVPFELHIYPIGCHGLGLADKAERDVPHVAQWSDSCRSWLELIGFIK